MRPHRPGATPALDFARVAIIGQIAQLTAHGRAQQPLQPLAGLRRQFTDCPHSFCRQLSLGHRADPPHQFDRQILQKSLLISRVDHHQAIRLGHLRGDLSQVLGPRHTDGNGQPQLFPNPRANGRCHFAWWAEQMLAASHIGKSFIDGNALDFRGEITKHRNRRVTEPLIIGKAAAHKNQIRAQFPRPPPGHTARNPERLGLIRSGQHHPASHGDRQAAQGGIKQLFDRRIKGIQIGMQNGGGTDHEALFGSHLNKNISRTNVNRDAVTPTSTQRIQQSRGHPADSISPRQSGPG